MISQHSGRIEHVLVADAAGRHEPVSGALDLRGHLDTIETSGYRAGLHWNTFLVTTTELSLAGLTMNHTIESG